MKRFAPFLKLYTGYVRNCDKALDLVEQWSAKSPEFAKMINNLQTAVSAETFEFSVNESVEGMPWQRSWLADSFQNPHAIGCLMAEVMHLTL